MVPPSPSGSRVPRIERVLVDPYRSMASATASLFRSPRWASSCRVATTMWAASTSKCWRRAVRVSDSPKPSVPSGMNGCGPAGDRGRPSRSRTARSALLLRTEALDDVGLARRGQVACRSGFHRFAPEGCRRAATCSSRAFHTCGASCSSANRRCSFGTSSECRFSSGSGRGWGTPFRERPNR